MLPELIPVWRRWRETHAALLDCLEQFPEDRLHWRPGGNAPPASGILVHIAAAECRYALQIRPEAEPPPGFPIRRSPEERARLAASLEDRAACVALVNTAAAFAERLVESLRPEELEREAADEWNPLGPRVEGPLTGLWFIEQMNRHKAYHLGQLWSLAMMAETPDAAG